jgi:anti-sigma B factor antagonist
MELDAEDLGDGITLIRLSGRMDVEGTSKIETPLAARAVHDRGAAIVDLVAVDFLTSYGIRALMLTAKALRARGGRMVLLSPNTLVRRVLETAGVDQMIPVFDSLQDARAGVQAA